MSSFGVRCALIAALASLCQPCAAWANPPAVAVVSSRDALPYRQMQVGFEQRMRDLGSEVAYQRFSFDADPSREVALLQRLEQAQPDLVFVLGSLASEVAVRALKDRPIVASMILDDGVFAQSTNTTGVLLSYPIETHFDLLQKLCPDSRTVGLIYHREDNPFSAAAIRHANRYGLRLVDGQVARPKDLPAVLERLARSVDAYWVLPDPVVTAPQAARAILLSSFRNRIPVVGPSAPWVKAGALYAPDWDYAELGGQGAEIAHQLLKGVAASSLPFVYPRSVRYTLNLKTAKHMKMSIPTDLVDAAKEVFQ